MQHIIQQLFRTSSLADVPREKIQALVAEYPSYGVARYLLSQKLMADNDASFQEETLKTNLYFSNPYWLQWQLKNQSPAGSTGAAGYHPQPAQILPAIETSFTPGMAETAYTPEAFETPLADAIPAAEAETPAFPEPTESPVQTQEEPSAADQLLASIAQLRQSHKEHHLPPEIPPSVTASEESADQELPAEPAIATESETSSQSESGSGSETSSGSEISAAFADASEKAEEPSAFSIAAMALEQAEYSTEPKNDPTDHHVDHIEHPPYVAEPGADHELTEPETVNSSESEPQAAAEPQHVVESQQKTEPQQEIEPQQKVESQHESEPQQEAEPQPKIESHTAPGPDPEPAPAPEPQTEIAASASETPFTASIPQPIIAAAAAAAQAAATASAAQPASEHLVPIEPYHTIDYFASQGIKLTLDDISNDKLGRQLKSFTDWLKTMRRLPAKNVQNIPDIAAEHKVRAIAAHSIEGREILTETMAEVLVKQGMREKATEVYKKLSLLNPDKNSYFAKKIEQLKID